MKLSLDSFEPLDPNTEKMKGIYKTDNFINGIAFRVSLCFIYFLFKYTFPIVICGKFL